MSILQRALLVTSLAGLLLPSLGSAQLLKDLLYNSVTPCVVADTRVAGGAITAGTTRTWNVVGTASLAAQGGSATGCGVPGFSGTTPLVQAVELNVTAVTAAAAGDLEVWAADVSPTASFLNYATGWTVANTGAVAVAQTSGVGDFKVKAQVGNTHVVVSVVGYYMRAPQEVLVHPIPGDATGSGTALTNALAGITDAAASKHYVLRVEAGTYDLGTGFLTMKPYVDIVGSGQQATIIEATGNSTSLSIGTILGASNTELRNLQVQSTVASGSNNAFGVVISNATNVAVRDVTVAVSASGSGGGEGIRSDNSNTLLERVTVSGSGSASAGLIGLSLVGDNTASTPTVRHAVVNLAGTASTLYGIYVAAFAVPAEIRYAEVVAAGSSSSNAVGLYVNWSNEGLSGNTLTVSTSTFQASGASQNYGIEIDGPPTETLLVDQTKATASGGTSYGLYNQSGLLLKADRSELSGGTGSITAASSVVYVGASHLGGAVTASTAVCAASYSGAYTALSAACL